MEQDPHRRSRRRRHDGTRRLGRHGHTVAIGCPEDASQGRKHDCKQTTRGAVERACKKDAKAQEAQEAQDKADAPLDYKVDKHDIKANTK
ncbi:MAG: hypothetical protein ABIR54_04825 [Burkholderiaceae bacterium]